MGGLSFGNLGSERPTSAGSQLLRSRGQCYNRIRFKHTERRIYGTMFARSKSRHRDVHFRELGVQQPVWSYGRQLYGRMVSPTHTARRYTWKPDNVQ